MTVFNRETGEYEPSLFITTKHKHKKHQLKEHEIHEHGDVGFTFNRRYKDDPFVSTGLNDDIRFNKQTSTYVKSHKSIDDNNNNTNDDIQRFKSQSQTIYNHLINNSITKKLKQNGKTHILNELPEGVSDKARMVELSYNIEYASNLDDLKEAGEIFNESIENTNLKFIPERSSRQIAVVYDEVKHKMYVAFHGARNASKGVDKEKVKQVLKGNFHQSEEFKQVEKEFVNLLIEAKDKNVKVETVSYSLGGYKATYLGEKYNVEGTHLNPFLQPLFKHNDVSPVINKSKQTIIRVVDDPTTAHSLIAPSHTHNRRYVHMTPLKSNNSHLDAHGLDQFIKDEPREVNNIVKKGLKTGQALGHVGEVGGVVIGGYVGYQEGKHNSGEVSEEVYRGTLGAFESTLPIVGETDIIESGLIGFTHKEIHNFFNTIFGKKDKPNELPAGYVQVWGTPEKTEPEEPEQTSSPSTDTTPLRTRFVQPMG